MNPGFQEHPNQSFPLWPHFDPWLSRLVASRCWAALSVMSKRDIAFLCSVTAHVLFWRILIIVIFTTEPMQAISFSSHGHGHELFIFLLSDQHGYRNSAPRTVSGACCLCRDYAVDFCSGWSAVLALGSSAPWYMQAMQALETSLQFTSTSYCQQSNSQTSLL